MPALWRGESSSRAHHVEAEVADHRHRPLFPCDIVCGNEVKLCKPAPDIFLEAARRIKVDIHDCMVLEDSHNGIRAATPAVCRNRDGARPFARNRRNAQPV